MKGHRSSYDLVVLSGDIGGTNINLGLLGKKGASLDMLFERHYKTQEETSFLEPLKRFLAEAMAACPAFPPELCCFSGAGPVVGERIKLTNAPWDIDAQAIRGELGIRTLVINDFSAISYGVMLLDPGDPEELAEIPHRDGSLPVPQPGGIRAIVGAGTGLGVGFVVRQGDRVKAYPSEGGHASLPVYDDETRALSLWLESVYGCAPGAEAAVSGMGIARILAFLVSQYPNRVSAQCTAILELPEALQARRISESAESDTLCGHAMDCFVRLYARFASDITAAFLPTGGLYMAGGIAAKNLGRFIGNGQFMEYYERSYREHIRVLLRATPVYIVKDYDISLYGAANAAIEVLS